MNDNKQYFNKLEFTKAKNLALINPENGLIAYNEYLKKYPYDYSAYAYYISLLINLGKLDKAEKLIDFIDHAYRNEAIFKKNNEKARALYYNIIYCKLRLFAYQKKYQEFLQLYNNNKEILPALKNEVPFYFQRKIDKRPMERNQNTYLFRQIIEYSEDDFRNHVNKHLAEFSEDDNASSNVFAPRFPIDKVIIEIKKYIPSNKKLCLGFIDNDYIFKYDECGRDNNKLVDYFKVIVFDDTNNIITMCPTVECENLPYVDLNYLKEKEEIKIKKISQIDKFNARYGRK